MAATPMPRAISIRSHDPRMVTPGLYMLGSEFMNREELDELVVQISASDWSPTKESGPYSTGSWRSIELVDKGQQTAFFSKYGMNELATRFACPIVKMSLYSLLPGASLHPHRDMTGAVGLGNVRLHVPIQTNPGAEFTVSGHRVVMQRGELWAVDTSYLHSAANMGAEERIHLMVEVKVTRWLRELLPPRNMNYYRHQAALCALIVVRAVHSLLVNIVVDRRRLRSHISIGMRALRDLFKRSTERQDA